MQVYRLLFGPLPDLDGKLGFLRKQEPWSRLGSNPLLQMEVRGLALGEGWKERRFLSSIYILGICGVYGKVEAGSDSSAPQHRASTVNGHSKLLCSLR